MKVRDDKITGSRRNEKIKIRGSEVKLVEKN